MAKLYTAKEVHTKLTKKQIVTTKLSTFHEHVEKGKIPFHHVDGKMGKFFKYTEVKEALIKQALGSRPPKNSKPMYGSNLKTGKTLNEDFIDKLDNAPEPKKGQSQQEYGAAVVAELGVEPTLTDANIYKTIYIGKREKLRYETDAGLLISRDDVESKAFEVARTIRDKLLTVPERLSNELASIDDPHMIKELLYKEFKILLDGFSEEAFNV